MRLREKLKISYCYKMFFMDASLGVKLFSADTFIDIVTKIV